MGSSIGDLWDDATHAVTGWWEDMTDVDAWKSDPFGNVLGLSGPVSKAAWNGIRDTGNEIGGKIGRATGLIQDGDYDLSDSGTSSAAGEGMDNGSVDSAISQKADTSGIPAVAHSISADAANAVAAQNSARKRAKGILSTYTRFGSDTTTGKTKLGE